MELRGCLSRRLSSATLQKAVVATLPEGQTLNITLSVDRSESNSTGVLHYLYFVDPVLQSQLTAQVQFKRIRNGMPTKDLLTVDNLAPSTLPAPENLELTKIRQGEDLQPDDTLLIGLEVKSGSNVVANVEVAVAIVARTVLPMPEAAYAALRQNADKSVECIRFAFGPAPARIELTDPNDLKGQIVRRRAVFRWLDVHRISVEPKYVIQKTTAFGSTHFPEFS